MLGLNVRAGRFEIDVIARRGQRVVFVEVKERGEGSWGGAVEAVDAEKRRRIRQAAEVWLRARPELRDCVKSFDVVAVGPRRIDRIARAF